MKIKPLEYKDLINIRPLRPIEIPIHPEVCISDFIYTTEFLEEVRESLSDSLKKYVAEYEKIRDTDLNMDITEEGILGTDEVLFDRINSYIGSKSNSIEVAYHSSNVALDKKPYRALIINDSYPIPKEKLKTYFIPHEYALAVPNWYSHNALDNGKPIEFYFINFEMLVNNLGIKKLQQNNL